MDNAAVALEHGALVATLSAFAETASGGSVERFGGLVAIVTGTPIPIFNAVLVESDDAKHVDLDGAIEHMDAAGVPWSMYTRRGIDDRLAGRFGRDVPVVSVPGMLLRPIPDYEPPAELVVRRAVDAGSHQIHVDVVAEAFATPVEAISAFTPVGLTSRDDVVICNGFVEGEVVATALAVVSGHVATVFNVATRSESRRRGYGAAMTMAVLLAARATGCDVGSLQSTEDGFPVYRRLGFETVVTYDARIAPRPPSPSPASVVPAS